MIFSGFGCTKEQDIPDLQRVRNWLNSPEIKSETKSSPEEFLNKIEAGKKIDLLKPWALLFEARWSIQKDDMDAARQAISNIPDDSPAFLDASLLNIKMGLKNTHNSNYFERELVLLEAQILKMNQPQLIPELLHSMALSFEKKKDFHSALNMYQKIRSQYSDTFHADRAKEAISSLKEGPGAPIHSPPLADQLEEAKILILEKDFQKAYELLQNAKKTTRKNIPAYYEISMNEVDLLMSSGRKSEALLLLSNIKNKVPTPSAARALLTLIMTAYQDKNYPNALEHIKNFETQFHEKHYQEEIQFMRAKVKKETGDLDEAKLHFKRVLDRKPSLKNVLETLRQLAWIAYMQNDLKESARYFTLLLEQSSEVSQLLFDNGDAMSSHILIEEYLPYSEKYSLKRKVHTESKELIHDIGKKVYFLLSHATYWLSHIKKRQNDLDGSENLSSSLPSSFPFSYYTILAQKQHSDTLGLDSIKENERTSNSKHQNYIDRSKVLMKANLYTEAIRQMSWDYSLNQEGDDTKMSLAVMLPIQIAGIMQELLLLPQSIQYLEREFPVWKVQKYYLTYIKEMHHENMYLKVRYPNVHSDIVKKIASSSDIPVNLLFSLQKNNLSLSKAELEILAKSYQAITQHEPELPIALIMLWGSQDSKDEVTKLREKYPYLSPEVLLELISDTSLRDTIQEIILDAAWYKKLNKK